MDEILYSVQMVQEFDGRYFMILLKKDGFNVSTTIHFVEKSSADSIEEAVRIGFKEVYNVEIPKEDFNSMNF